jgi:ABC-type branched-subunit amino acid transport system ATPase component
LSLTCTGIRKRYGGFVVLRDVSLGVESGEILGVAGPNGAGKTTLFDILSGHLRPDSGHVVLNGQDATRRPAYRRARQGLARTFQSPLVPAGLTVGEALEASRVSSRPLLDRSDVARGRTLARFRTDEGVICSHLDTLGRRKLLLACLLMHQPSVLLLDEPCSGLVQDEIDEIDGIIRNVASESGTAVMVVEHRLELLTAVAGRVAVLDEGAKIAEGPPDEVFDDPAVRAAYFEAPGKAA